jgi:hypothetical protein
LVETIKRIFCRE